MRKRGDLQPRPRACLSSGTQNTGSEFPLLGQPAWQCSWATTTPIALTWGMQAQGLALALARGKCPLASYASPCRQGTLHWARCSARCAHSRTPRWLLSCTAAILLRRRWLLVPLLAVSPPSTPLAVLQ